MKAAVFLDRDNTIIHNDGDLGDADQVKMIQGAASAIASLKGLNYHIVVVTNQGGVARGQYGEQDVDAVHQRINELVKRTTGVRIDRFYYCPFHPEGTVKKYAKEHEWRKPRPGMLLQAAKDMRLDMSRCWMIGDQPRDIEAGRAAGVRTMLLTNATSDVPPLAGDAARDIAEQAGADFVARNLTEAVRIIAKQRRPEINEDLRKDDETLRLPQKSEGGEPVAEAAPKATPDVKAAVKRKPRPFRPLEKLVEEPPDDDAQDEAPRDVGEAAVAAAPSTAATDDAVVEVDRADADEVEPPPRRRRGKPPTPKAEVTLREILAELRNQRTAGDDFSYVKVLAIVLQLTAGVCLLAALLMGRGESTVFFQWLGTGILLQMATIAMLLFSGER